MKRGDLRNLGILRKHNQVNTLEPIRVIENQYGVLAVRNSYSYHTKITKSVNVMAWSRVFKIESIKLLSIVSNIKKVIGYSF